MKFKTRLKIAYDMCLKQLMTFRVSVILFAIVLTLLGIIVYRYSSSYDYRMLVQAGFSKPLNDVYYMISDLHNGSDDDYPLPDISQIDGISELYKYQITYNTSDCLQFLKEVNKNEYTGDEGIEEIWMFSSNLDLFNVDIIEGIKPGEIDYSIGIPLYLSENYKKITSVGDCYSDESSKYYVAGYFSSDSSIPNDNASYNYMDGLISLKYGIIEMCPMINYDGYFFIEGNYTIEDIFSQIQEEYAKSNSVVTISNIDNSIIFLEKNIDKNVKYLVVAAFLLMGTNIIVLLVIQISNIFVRKKEYGILLICNATQKDIRSILVIQNFIRFFYAEIIAFLIINLLIRKILYAQTFAVNEITHKISNSLLNFYVFPSMIGIGLFITIITLILPMIKLSKMTPVEFLRGKN